jgi:hypothetical protein
LVKIVSIFDVNHRGAMNVEIVLSKPQRFWLWITAIVGLVGPNGLFLYFALYRGSEFSVAMNNPITRAFMLDAFAAMAILAYLFAKWRVGRLSWIWFIVLSLIGGLMFSVPAFVLISSKEDSPLQKMKRPAD